jgi:hypothetical protein
LRECLFCPNSSNAVAVSSDRELVAAADTIITNFTTNESESFVDIFDSSQGESMLRIQTPPEISLAFVAHHEELAGVDSNGAVHVWDTRWGSVSWSGDPSAGMFDDVVASPNGKRLLAADDSHFGVWDTQTGKLLADVADTAGYDVSDARFRNRIAFSADSKYILIGNAGEVSIWKSP